jgi:formamidopyrimidine-DNA glycosylase
MPELPEVETIKTELSPYVIGRSITDVTLLWEGIVRQPSVAEFRSRITGQKIVGLARRGKYLLVNLNRGDLLIIHLKMTGALLVGRDSQEPPRFTRAIIHLDGGTSIFFRDPRKFGLMRLVKNGDSVVGKLGPEPLESEFTPEVLQKLLARRQAPIKALLCDQNFIAGIGNMYADEALFAARIHPMRIGASLSREETKRLHRAICQVLKAGIGHKGASVQNYYRPDGTMGTAHFEFKVAHRGGEPCPKCGTSIERITVRGRGTYFCPKCQPAR